MVAAEHEEEELPLMKKKVGADEEEGRVDVEKGCGRPKPSF